MSTPLVAAFLLAAAVCVGCGDGPRVVQGRVVSYDADTSTLTLEDERAPGSTLVVDTSAADVGAQPEAGDNIRVAYRMQGDRAVAGRVMNLTRQAELRGGAGH